MAKFLVQKSGPLNGEVVISGAKNAVLPLMAATILSEEECVISDVPQLKDVDVMKEILLSIGGKIKSAEEGVLSIDMGNIEKWGADYDLVSRMRASFLVMGSLLGRCGRAKVYMPGGCTIGARPIDLHLKGFEALGAEIIVKDNFIEATAPEGGLRGESIYLDFPSVGATENIMAAAVLAEGTTYIENAAEEPEIVDLANFLNKMGARIKGAGTDTIKIEGVERVHGASHTVIPDRIEAGTYMLAAAITRGTLLIKNMVPDHVKPITAKLRESGVTVELADEGLYVDASGDRKLVAADIKTLPYPGFPTDLQSMAMALLSTANGVGIITESLYENRFMQVPELRRMGADIHQDRNHAIIKGVKKLTGATLAASDLRAGASLVVAALMAEGNSVIENLHHIDRGYENFETKLRLLGGKIERRDDIAPIHPAEVIRNESYL